MMQSAAPQAKTGSSRLTPTELRYTLLRARLAESCELERSPRQKSRVKTPRRPVVPHRGGSDFDPARVSSARTLAETGSSCRLRAVDPMAARLLAKHGLI